MAFLLGSIYVVVVGAVLVSMAVLLLRGNKEIYNRIFMICQGLVVLWCTSQILILLSQTRLELTVSYVLGNVGICFIGAFWYLFAVHYRNGGMKKVWKYVPVVVAAFHYLAVLSNSWHHLYYKEFGENGITYGPLFYSNVCITYGFIIAGSVLLYHSLSSQKESSREKNLIIASVLVPLFLNVVQVSGMIKASFDITPLGFGVSIILVMLATLKYHFLDLNRELAITNEKLLLEKERNRIAQQVHDTAGHTLTMIQSYMKLAQVANNKEETQQVGEYLEQARTLTNQGIRELRESINQLRREASYELVTQGIMQLADQVKEIPVEVTVKGEDSEKYSHLSGIIYDCVRECITNTLKYAQASKMEIIVRFQDNAVEVMIADDGKGCETITDNNGIRGIKERVLEAGGTVRFISGVDEGFLTRIRLEMGGKARLF